MSDNTLLSSQWLSEQRRHHRQLVLIANPMAEPNPVSSLFAQAPIRDYIKLYQGTEFNNLANLGPWLVRIDASAMPALSALLQTPTQHWGWVASAQDLDLSDVAAHWRARMIIRDGDQRAFYRLQDNRVIGRHLQVLSKDQIPFLLGPLNSALCWSEDQWLAADNLQPDVYPEPFETPWLEVPPPEALSTVLSESQLTTWLWENHPQATQQLVTRESIAPWVKAQLTKAKAWGWAHQEQVQFLLERQLCPGSANHPRWAPRNNESPDAHFLRATREVSSTNNGVME